MNISACPFASANIDAYNIQYSFHGYVQADSDWKCESMSIPYSKLYFVKSGSAHICCGGIDSEISAGNVYLVPYGTQHSFYCEDSMEKLYFHFTMTRPRGSDVFAGCDRLLCLPFEKDRTEQLTRLYFSECVNDIIRLKSELYTQILRFITHFEIISTPYPEYSAQVNAAIDYINSNLSQALKIEDIANNLFVSPSMLSKHFSAEVGISIGKYIDRAVSDKAQRLLLISNESIHTISEKLGFCDQFYFARKFRQSCGVSPSEYRRTQRRQS